MSEPRVVHCKKEPYDVYIGRPSKFGNPFSHLDNTLAKFKVSSRNEAVDEFEKLVNFQPEFIKAIKAELKDKILGCWCSPKRCHGDVLLKIANE